VSSRLNSAILDLTRDKMKVRMGAGVCSYAKTKASSQSQITNWTRVTFKMANHSLVSLNRDTDTFGKMDPFLVLRFEGETHTT
jgi:hypothetical protein